MVDYDAFDDQIVYYKSSENMNEIDDNSIDVIVTSPPYNRNKLYSDDLGRRYNDNQTEEEDIRVLYVDDEAYQHQLVKIFLEGSDPSIRVHPISSPKEALLKLDQTYDCIVSDFSLPEMDGIEFAQTVKEKVDIPIIIYTGRGSEEDASAAFAAGVDDYVLKGIGDSHFILLANRIKASV